MKIVYIPLDERPCNTVYPIEAAKVVTDLKIIMPDLDLLGKKKTPGDINGLKTFLIDNAKTSDAIVLSTEMLVYGGLLPSRLHSLEESSLQEYKRILKIVKESNPNIKIYVSNLIMRTPRFSSSDEEPDYYEEYGSMIFKCGWLKDKKNRDNLTDEEKNELLKLTSSIPSEYIEDYEKRREFNVKVNLLNISLYKEGVIDFVVVPQDDAAEYGYTAMDQGIVYHSIRNESLKDIMIYPGADEVGFSLLARAYNEQKKRRPKVYAFYSSTYGPYITPLYEDRPINETLKAHVMSTGCELVYSPKEADIALAYNTPGKKMQESWDQFTKQDITYSTFRHLPTFVREIESMLEKNLPVVIADSAYSNGGDGELVELLDKKNLLNKLSSYKAWNTNGNTLGSTLAAGVFALENQFSKKLTENLLLHLYEDFIYQGVVRMNVTDHQLPKLGLNYFDLKEEKDKVIKLVRYDMLSQGKEFFKNTILLEEENLIIDFPWNRMFEIYCQVRLSE